MEISRFVNQIEAFDDPLNGSFLVCVCFASVPIIHKARIACMQTGVKSLSHLSVDLDIQK